MNNYRLRIDYTTGAGRKQFTLVDVEATSLKAAKARARRNFDDDYRRAQSIIDAIKEVKDDNKKPCTEEKVVAVFTRTVPCDEPFKVGQTIEIRRGDNKGTSIVRSFFVDARGYKYFVVEKLGYVPTNKSRFGVVGSDRLRELTTAEEKVIYKIIYPDGRMFESDFPYKNSTYDIDQLIQVKVTTVDGKIIKKEIV